MLMATSPQGPIGTGAPLIRCLAIYRRMPIRFALTALMLLAVNVALVAQQGLVGRAVHEAGLGRLVVRDAAGGLDYSRAWFWVAVLLSLSAARAIVQYGAGLLSLAIGQEFTPEQIDKLWGGNVLRVWQAAIDARDPSYRPAIPD